MISIPVYFAALMYAITGGPSSGKTSIIEELAKRGEPVVHEAATDWIKTKISTGNSTPWKEESFTLDILKLQIEREIPHLSLDGRVFIDRGLFDGYAFAMTHGLAGTETLASLNEILNPIDLNERYQAVFFVLPYEDNFSPLQTEVRRENAQEAAKLEVAAYTIYCRHRNFILVPGGLTPQKRADFIMEKIREIDR
jgi:predicted ATPase